MRLPFWSKISENGKQFLAIIAVAQAIHFVIAAPLGIYDGWKWRKDIEEQVRPISRADAAEQSILSTLWKNANGPFQRFAYREICSKMVNRKDYFYDPPTQADCNKIKTLREIVQEWVSIYEVPDDQIGDLLFSLELAGLPVSKDNYGLSKN